MAKIEDKSFNLNKKEYYTQYFKIVSLLEELDLTNKEIEILVEFFLLDKTYTEGNMFNKVARKKVLETLKTSYASLSNYISVLIHKKVLIRNENTGLIFLNENYIPDDTMQGFRIKLTRKDAS
jgi:chaperonin cofactor prefoldin